MPEIKDARGLFVHQLGEALNMERTVLTMLKQNEQAAGRPDLKQLFAHHRDETEGQIRNLEQAFDLRAQIGEIGRVERRLDLDRSHPVAPAHPAIIRRAFLLHWGGAPSPALGQL